MYGHLLHNPTGDLVHNPGMYPDWELNRQPLDSQADAQFTEPHQPGLEGLFVCFVLFFYKILHRPESSSYHPYHTHHLLQGPGLGTSLCSCSGHVIRATPHFRVQVPVSQRIWCRHNLRVFVLGICTQLSNFPSPLCSGAKPTPPSWGSRPLCLSPSC